MLHLKASNFLPLILECQINICEIGLFAIMWKTLGSMISGYILVDGNDNFIQWSSFTPLICCDSSDTDQVPTMRGSISGLSIKFCHFQFISMSLP